MRTESCGNCDGTAAIVRRDYQFSQLGIPVILQDIEVIECSECGSVEPVIPNVDGLMICLASAVIEKPNKLDGNEIKFLRKVAGKSAGEFARLLHVNHTHLSKVENNRLEVGDQLDKLIRLLVTNMTPELKGRNAELIALMPEIDDECVDEGQSLQINPATMQAHYAMA